MSEGAGASSSPCAALGVTPSVAAGTAKPATTAPFFRNRRLLDCFEPISPPSLDQPARRNWLERRSQKALRLSSGPKGTAHVGANRPWGQTRLRPIRILMTDQRHPYTLWFVDTPNGGRLRLVIWPRAGVVHAVLQGGDEFQQGDFTTVEAAEAWGKRLFGKLCLSDPLLTGYDHHLMTQVPGRC